MFSSARYSDFSTGSIIREAALKFALSMQCRADRYIELLSRPIITFVTDADITKADVLPDLKKASKTNDKMEFIEHSVVLTEAFSDRETLQRLFTIL